MFERSALIAFSLEISGRHCNDDRRLMLVPIDFIIDEG